MKSLQDVVLATDAWDTVEEIRCFLVTVKVVSGEWYRIMPISS